jgi:antitoxin FitA
MSAITVRNLPEETHRALKVRAAKHGRSTEAEIRDILEAAVKPRDRIKLGSLLADIGRKAKLSIEDTAVFEAAIGRGNAPSEPIRFD